MGIRCVNYTGYAEGIARTNKLWCSSCGKKIQIGNQTYFYLEDGRMEDAYCESCAPDMERDIDDYGCHEYAVDN